MGTENYRDFYQTPGRLRDSGPRDGSFADGDQVRRFDRIFNFLHNGLDRVQNISEAVASSLFWLAQLWPCQFVAGIAVGLLFVFSIFWLLIRVF